MTAAELPKNWAKCKLGDIVELEYGKGLPKGARNLNGQYPVYGSNGIVGFHDSFLINGPAIVVGRKGGAGIATFAKDNFWPIDTTYFVRSKEFYDLQFIYYLIQSLRLNQFDRSTAIPGLNRDDAYSLDIGLPPLNEQKRIVAKIEELFSELDKGIESLKTASEQLKVYRKAVLNGAANGDLLVSKGLIKKPFGDEFLRPLREIVSELGQGWSPKCFETPSPNNKTWGVVKTTAIQHLSFDEAANKELPSNLSPRAHLEIKVGDILVTRAGPRNRVGVTCLVKKCRPKLILCDKAYRLRVKSDLVLPEYLEMLLNCPFILFEIEQLKTGINDSGVNLTQDRFMELKVKVPSLELQEKILNELSGILSNIDSLLNQIDETLLSSEALRQSILKKAFSGQLVAQDKNDEPASALLERIEAENEAPQSKIKKKRSAA